tara:strand:- start:35 stop:829 length:795 start_codon:yes stop_codon:yes gene_type:complete
MKKCVIKCQKENQDLYTEILFAKGALSVSEYESPSTEVSSKQELSTIKLEAFFESEIDLGLPNPIWSTVQDEQWKTMSTLIVGPYQLNCPNTVFGDGNHPTTELCKRILKINLDNYAGVLKDLSCLDIGTGSGILAVWASVLGVGQVDACDIDPESVRITSENISKNKIDNITVFQEDILKWESQKKYDIVIANVLTEVLEKALEKIIALVNQNGLLILSGISEHWADAFESKLNKLKQNQLNSIEINSFFENGWVGFLLRVKD